MQNGACTQIKVLAGPSTATTTVMPVSTVASIGTTHTHTTGAVVQGATMVQGATVMGTGHTHGATVMATGWEGAAHTHGWNDGWGMPGVTQFNRIYAKSSSDDDDCSGPKQFSDDNGVCEQCPAGEIADKERKECFKPCKMHGQYRDPKDNFCYGCSKGEVADQLLRKCVPARKNDSVKLNDLKSTKDAAAEIEEESEEADEGN